MSAPNEPPGGVATQRIGPWLVHFIWPPGVTQGGPRHIRITPAQDGDPQDIARGLSSTVLRRVDFGKAAEQWRAARALETEQRVALRPRLEAKLNQELRQWAAEGRISEGYLARLAAMYVSLVNQGEPAVTAKLAEVVGKRPETIRAHLKEARSKKLLTSVKGKSGGELTVQALELLGLTKLSGEFVGPQ